jgi:hypothetical protein
MAFVVVWGLWQTGRVGRASKLTVIILACLVPLLALYWFVSRRANRLSRVV